MVVYEPQIASWANQKHMVAFAAASYQTKGAAATVKPALGTIKLEAETSVSLDTAAGEIRQPANHRVEFSVGAQRAAP